MALDIKKVRARVTNIWQAGGIDPTQVPCRSISPELAVSYYCADGNDPHACPAVSYKEMKAAGLDEEALYRASVLNGRKDIVVVSLQDFMLLPPGAGTDLAAEGKSIFVPEMDPIFVGTNRAEKYGAEILLHPDKFRCFGRDLFLVPGSVDEVFIVPMGFDLTAEDAAELVSATADVEERERLDDHVYLYRWKTGEIEM